MEKLNQRKFAIASGTTSVIIYLGCYLVMLLLGEDGIVKLSNYLFHGIDFTSIIRMDIPIGETLLGAFISFIFWGLVGYLVAIIYNKIK